QEEVPLLRKEQTEAGEVDLAVVDFGRREIRIQGQRTVQRRCELVENVERRLEIRRAARRSAVDLRVGHAHRRHDVESETLFELRETDCGPCDAWIQLSIPR